MQYKNILSNIRCEINKIDQEILFLLSKRKKIVTKIAKKKIINHIPIQDLKREKELLNNLQSLCKKYFLNKSYIIEIFKIIINDSVMLQKNIKQQYDKNKFIKQKTIAFLGPKGSYSYISTKKYIKKNKKKYHKKKYDNFIEIFQSVKDKISEYAIVPIENSYSGFIEPVHSMLINNKLKIYSEFHLPIKHCILSPINTTLQNITTIYSHPQSFQQCSQFIQNFPHWKIKYTNSTSQAMKIISQMNTYTAAAIGSKIGKKIYNLQIIKEKIANDLNNQTRFFILSQQKYKINNSQPIKATLIIKNKIIKQDDIIKIFQKNHILISIFIPIIYILNNKKKMGFYIETKEHNKLSAINQIIYYLKEKKIFIKCLGKYPILNISNNNH
ncbi:Bifunctional chorismate mutase/prephenate dehydratase [Buchnera aphidicola (Pterocallis alni)]|uniref:chorismate mutase n=1 Tax=Buchnera aphidicola TaxID=9 RepID=UPI00346473D1